MNITSRFQLFSIITKCICSFSDSNVRKQIDFCQERTLVGEEGQRCTALAHCINARRKEEAHKKAKEEAC
jgi:hypothetical protein